MNNSQKQNQTKVQRAVDNTKNSNLFMLLGMALALLTVYAAIELKTEIKPLAYIPEEYYPTDDVPEPPVLIEKPQFQKPVEVPLVKVDPIDIKIVDNTKPDDNRAFVFIDDNTPQTDIGKKIDHIIEVKIIENETVDFFAIEKAPVFPGCKGNNEELKQCFSDKVQAFVAKNYNASLTQDLGLTTGIKRIHVQFIVDKTGNITDVKVRAPHQSLAKEAERVVNLLPKMQPAKQRENEVGVKFQLPITINVEE